MLVLFASQRKGLNFKDLNISILSLFKLSRTNNKAQETKKLLAYKAIID
jgi:hypothetical protein